MSNTRIADDDTPIEEPGPPEEEVSWFERLQIGRAHV